MTVKELKDLLANLPDNATIMRREELPDWGSDWTYDVYFDCDELFYQHENTIRHLATKEIWKTIKNK